MSTSSNSKRIRDLPGLIEEIRSRFAHVDTCPLTGPRIFFENAGGALTLNSVVETSAFYSAIPDNQGRANPASAKLMEVISNAKADIRTFFNAESGQAIVGESGTELLFRLISAAATAQPEGGVILGSTLEHPATRSACHRWAEITHRPHLLVPHNNDTGTVTHKEYATAITPDLRVATIVHTSPVTGMTVDVPAIVEAIRAKSPDCLIIVDGIQHACHGGIDLAAADIDGYVISPYKVFSRHGYGIAWVSERFMTMPHDCLVGGPIDNWELGTRDTGSYATFTDVVDYFSWLGGHFTSTTDKRARIEAAGRAIHSHEKCLTDAILFGTGNLKGLAEMDGVNIIGGKDNPAREGLVSFYVDGKASADLVASLSEAGIRVHIRKDDHYSGNILKPLGQSDCVRVSLCHYNTEAEGGEFLSAMAQILESK